MLKMQCGFNPLTHLETLMHKTLRSNGTGFAPKRVTATVVQKLGPPYADMENCLFIVIISLLSLIHKIDNNKTKTK